MIEPEGGVSHHMSYQKHSLTRKSPCILLRGGSDPAATEVRMRRNSPSSQSEIELVECALRQVTKMQRSGWDTIPAGLHGYFEEYMSKDVWTGECDPLTLPNAALLIVRDAITRTGTFGDRVRKLR